MASAPKGVRVHAMDADNAHTVLPERGRLHVVDRSIGDLLRQRLRLDDQQVDRVVAYQRSHGIHFGEAAVALKLASHDDVLWALSQQFHYPFASAYAGDGVSPELVVARDPFSDAAEVFRDVRTQLMTGVLSGPLPRSALAVLSPDVGDGKTFFAANLATSLAQLGGRTLVIDADLRTPRLHEIFAITAPSGLSAILLDRTDAQLVHRIEAMPNLYVLPAGALPPNPLDLVQAPAFARLIEEVSRKFDHVVVDTPAAQHGADARVIAAACGAAVVIARRGISKMQSLQKLLSQLGKAKVESAGVLVNEG